MEARRRWPQRFLQTNEIFYQEPVEDPAAWGECLDAAQKIFQTTTSRSVVLADTDPLYPDHRLTCPMGIGQGATISDTRTETPATRVLLHTPWRCRLQYQNGHNRRGARGTRRDALPKATISPSGVSCSSSGTATLINHSPSRRRRSLQHRQQIRQSFNPISHHIKEGTRPLPTARSQWSPFLDVLQTCQAKFGQQSRDYT